LIIDLVIHASSKIIQKTGYVQELNLLIFFAQLHVPHSHEKWVSS
jgi:hypothetical protein